jgi:hypothetical protein
MFRQPIDCILRAHFIFEIESEIVGRAAAGRLRAHHLFIFEIESEIVGRAAAGRLKGRTIGSPARDSAAPAIAPEGYGQFFPGPGWSLSTP